MKRVWLVGRERKQTQGDLLWGIVGIYTSEKLAVVDCTNGDYIAPVELNKKSPDGIHPFSGGYYVTDKEKLCARYVDSKD
jgi:hypothetical protein